MDRQQPQTVYPAQLTHFQYTLTYKGDEIQDGQAIVDGELITIPKGYEVVDGQLVIIFYL